MSELMWWIAAQPNALMQFLPLILIFVLFYFMIIRPQRKREREHQSMLAALRRGDKVITSSGIHGEIHSLTKDTVVLEIAPKVKITMQRSSILGKAAGSVARASDAEQEEEAASEAPAPSSNSNKNKKKKKKK